MRPSSRYLTGIPHPLGPPAFHPRPADNDNDKQTYHRRPGEEADAVMVFQYP